MNYIAPSGTPISSKTVMSWIIKSMRSGDPLESFSEKIKRRFNIKHCLFISSGRTALYLLLQCLYKLRDEKNRNQVIVPSYTCFSVPGSIDKASLTIRVCDIDPHTLSYDLEKLSSFDFSNVLAIVTSNLYGIPNELPEIEKIAKLHGIYLVDDAAQCLGGKINNSYSGTFGDVGLFSLDKGKNITSIQGGIIVTNSDEIAKSLDQTISSIPNQSRTDVLLDCVKLIVYASMLAPSRYWIFTKLAFMKLGLTPYTTDYPVHKYAPVLGEFASLLFDELTTLTHTRVNNALAIQNLIGDLPNVELISYEDNVDPVFLRLPVLIKNKDKREKLIMHLESQGIGATKSYPSSILDINQIKHKFIDGDYQAIGGRKVAEQIVTLPTHPYLSPQHIQRIGSIFDQSLS